MKIRVNYDLLDKINESKTGISINRTNTKHFLVVGLASLLNLPNIILSSNRVATLITYLTQRAKQAPENIWTRSRRA